VKTYDTFGALPERNAPGTDNGANATAIALLVQRALGVNVFADETFAYSQYSSRGLHARGMRELFVSGNLEEPCDPAPLPEFDYAVVVNVDEPFDRAETQAALEGIGLTLLRRRRREYALPPSDTTRPFLQLYGGSEAVPRTVDMLSRLLNMPFDGNEHASSGGDSHYYGESGEFGAILVFDNSPRPFDDLPFRQHSSHPSILIAVNPPHRRDLEDRLVGAGLALLKTAQSEQPR
jgi:hypothetical protein